MVNAVYFLESNGPPKIGFCGGLYGLSGPASAFVTRTTNGGVTWDTVKNIDAVVAITSFEFKDSLIGWFTEVRVDWTGDSSHVYRTTDGGITWNPFGNRVRGGCTDIYYHKYNHRLFIAAGDRLVADVNQYSTDEGLTWTIIPPYDVGAGIAFSDSLTGIISCWDGNLPDIYRYLYTSDGGTTWVADTLQFKNGLQLLGIPNSKTFFVVGYYPNQVENDAEYTAQVKRSDDGGKTWRLLSSLPFRNISGMIGGSLKKLYVHGNSFDGINPEGVMVSVDQGITWSSICGPPCSNDPQRFYLKDSVIYLPDAYGNLWLNATSKANGPRLQIEKNNMTRHKPTISGSITPIDVYYSTENYYENVDSLTFMLSFNDGMIFNHDSVAAGWKEIRREVTGTNVKFILQRTDPNPPQLDSFVLRAYCQATISNTTTGIVALDEINFNQDTTFRDCMVASLTNTDSLFVDITDNICGDSILRNFITTGKILSISSIHPNPAQDEIEIDLQSGMKQDANIEIRNALGAKVYSDTKNLISGSNNIPLDTKGFPSGMYIIRVSAPNCAVSQEFG